MDEFADVANARASYKTFAQAMNAGREIMRRAGVADPPPIPEFDAVYMRMNAEARQDLFMQLRTAGELSGKEAVQLWTPLIKRAFAVAKPAR